MNKFVIGAALAVMMGASSAQVFKNEVCVDASLRDVWTYNGAKLVSQEDRLDYIIVGGMKCVQVLREHTHQIYWHDNDTITKEE